MSPDMEALARRAVATKGWQWLGGAQWYVGSRFERVQDTGDHVPVDALPDLTDPATLGCLLALVREAHGDAYVGTVWDPEADRWTVIGELDPEWGIRDLEPGQLLVGPTEAAALVAALEAAL